VTRTRLLASAAVAALVLVAGAPAAQPPVASIAAGFYHSCALLTGNVVKCWGSNDGGQLADGTTKDRLNAVRATGLSGTMVSLTAGGEHTCALTSGGGLECWGDNEYGQLGDGRTAAREPPQAVRGLSVGVTAVAAGAIHTCALTGGGVECWGDNRYGELGNGSTTPSSVPVPVSGLTSGVQAIAAGALHTCALRAGGAVECWGFDEFGQLGDGHTTTRTAPVAVKGVSGARAIAAGGGHTCALLASGAMNCWGDNEYGQLGNGDESQMEPAPVEVSELPAGVRSIVAGFTDTCALTTGGAVYCWGNIFEDTPDSVDGLESGVTAIALNGGDTYDDHACAIVAAGGVKCWGSDDNGELGDGKTEGLDFTPSFVLALADGVQVLMVRVSGKGAVRGRGISCAESCGYERPAGARVVLTARATRHYRFKGWAGACHGRKRRCAVVLRATTSVTARFVKRR
jgi:alpha-tubulin suppressor-like RCC1 family protein